MVSPTTIQRWKATSNLVTLPFFVILSPFVEAARSFWQALLDLPKETVYTARRLWNKAVHGRMF